MQSFCFKELARRESIHIMNVFLVIKFCLEKNLTSWCVYYNYANLTSEFFFVVMFLCQSKSWKYTRYVLQQCPPFRTNNAFVATCSRIKNMSIMKCAFQISKVCNNLFSVNFPHSYLFMSVVINKTKPIQGRAKRT